MSPCIRDGDAIVVAPLPPETLPRLGQVVAFVHPSTRRLVVHRVVAKRNGSLLLKGDSTFPADGFISAAHILGYVTNVERRGQSVQFGLGPERLLIVFFSRMGPLFSFLDPLWGLIRPIVRRLAR